MPRIHRIRDIGICLTRLPPRTGDKRSIRHKGSRSNNVDDPRWRRKKRQEQVHDGSLDFVTAAFEKLASAFVLQAFEGANTCAVDEAVDSLNKSLLHLFDLGILFGPRVGGSSHVDRVDVVVVVDESVDGVLSQLESDLVLRDHVDVDNVGLDGQQVVVEHGLPRRLFAQLGVGCTGQHERRQQPDGGRGAKGFCQESKVLWDAVQRAFDAADALEGNRQPCFDPRPEHNGRGRARCECCCRCREQL